MLEKTGRNLSIGALVVMLILLPSEEHTDAGYKAAQVAVLAGFLLRLIAQKQWRLWAVAAGLFVVSMILLIGMGAGYLAIVNSLREAGKIAEGNLFSAGDIAKGLLTDVGVLYYCMLLIFLSQFMYRPQIWEPHDRWTKITLACMWAFGFIVILSAVFSTDPPESFRYIRKFMAPYILIYMVVVETLYSWRHYKIIITSICLVGIVTSIVSLSIRTMYLYGSPDVRREIFDRMWIRDQEFEWTNPETQELIEWREVRIQWPFDHHNRLCSYTMMICFFIWLQFFVMRNWELRTLIAVSIFIPFWTMMMTYTRGGVVGLAAGMAALILIVNWRAIWIFLALSVVIILVAPPELRNRVFSIVNPRTWTAGLGTASNRVVIWRNAIKTIGDRPILGLGYGWEQFEEYWERHYEPLAQEEVPSHAHNNFLEVGVETGLLGLGAFLAFLIALTRQLFQAMQQTKVKTTRRFVVAGFFGMFVAFLVFGMSNLSIRYRTGMLIWVCFGLMTLLPMILRFIQEDATIANGAPVPAPEPTPTSGDSTSEPSLENGAE